MSRAKNVSLCLASVVIFIIILSLSQSAIAKDIGDVKALIKVKQALKEKPDSTGAHMKYQDAMIGDGWRAQMIAEYSERLKKQGETPENIYLLARLKEDVEAQAAVYNDLIKKFPDFTWGYFGSAYVSWKRGDKTEAIKLFEHILKMDPKHSLAYQWIAYLYDKQNEYAKALEATAKGLQNLPDDAQLLAYHAAFLKTLERYEEALANADRALEIEPENELALRQRGWILALMERHNDAIAATETYLELWPSSVSTLDMLGLAYYKLYESTHNSRSLDKAEEAWLKALELSPDAGPIYLMLHFVYLKRDWPVHLLWYAQKGLKLAPDDVNAGAAETNIGSGAGMSAVSSSSRGVEIKRPNDYIRSLRDMSDKELTLLGKEDNETAWNALEQAMAGSSTWPEKEGIDELIKKFPKFAPAYYDRGVLAMWSYKDEEALDYLEKAVSLAKEWGRAHGALAAAQLRLKRYQDGRRTLKTAEGLDPDNPEIQFNVKLMRMFDEAVVGYTISELQDTLEFVRSKPDKAERALFGMFMFGDYLKRDPESIEIHELYADIFAASPDDGNWNTALKTYRKAIELGGDKNRLSAKIAEIEGRKK